MAHAQPSRSATEFVKSSVFVHLGHVMGNARKAYKGFREICINLRQAPFTVPPLFANVKYKFTGVQLRNHQARKKRQLLQETNEDWLKYLDGEIPQSKTKPIDSHPQAEIVSETKTHPVAKKRKRNSNSSPKEKQPTKTPGKKTILKIKKPRAPKASKPPQQQVEPQQESLGAVYDQLFIDYQAAHEALQFQQQQQQQLPSQQQPQQ